MRHSKWAALLVRLSFVASCSINPSGATVLELPEGEATESFEFEALDPEQWELTVAVMAPTGAVVDVKFTTSDGAILDIFQTPSDPDTADCIGGFEGFVECVSHSPILKDLEPGTWTATVHKISQAAAEVHVHISWDNPEVN